MNCKSPIAWVGGKYRLAEKIISLAVTMNKKTNGEARIRKQEFVWCNF